MKHYKSTYKNGIYFDCAESKKSDGNLVFVHGSGCNRKFLRALANQLSSFSCYLPDLPDHGKSNYYNCRSVSNYIDAVSDFVSDMENVTLIGHSLGGTICLGVAARNLPSVKNCIIISSGAKFDQLDERIHTMVQKHKMDWGYLMKCLGSLHCPSVVLDFLNFEKPEIVLKDFAIDIKLDIEEELDKIKIPTLITVSREDILTIPEYSHKLHEKIAGSKLVLFSGCRHMLPITKRKQVARLISDFLKTSHSPCV